MADDPIGREEFAELRRQVDDLKLKLINQNSELNCRLIRLEFLKDVLGTVFNPFVVGIGIMGVMWALFELAWLAGKSS
jgi:hypothetical protein